MKQYKLLSDAILDGARLRPQGFDSLVDEAGRTCALGAAVHAVTGTTNESLSPLPKHLTSFLDTSSPCPIEACHQRHNVLSLGFLITHLNDHHDWTRERIAGFVATVEESLGLCEIISDEPERQRTASVEGRAFSVDAQASSTPR
jgi:hypothetical protein